MKFEQTPVALNTLQKQWKLSFVIRECNSGDVPLLFNLLCVCTRRLRSLIAPFATKLNLIQTLFLGIQAVMRNSPFTLSRTVLSVL